jgi:hypothetical protein
MTRLHKGVQHMKAKQPQQVIEVMKELGGFATFGKLNSMIDFSRWGTRTPEASVRRIVQQNEAFIKIKPGLWALKEYEDEVLRKLNIANSNDNPDRNDEEFNHSYYQGLAVEIGNLRDMDTYVPGQDKNKLFLGRPLQDIAKTYVIHAFTYPEIIRYAKTVDVIWFNERKLPCAFIEIEHTTDIQNSLGKFFELQDFNAEFYIVADEYRHNKFNELINRSMYKPIKERVKFRNYELLADIHSKEYRRTYAWTL